jgi:hypothetical protein
MGVYGIQRSQLTVHLRGVRTAVSLKPQLLLIGFLNGRHIGLALEQARAIGRGAFRKHGELLNCELTT